MNYHLEGVFHAEKAKAKYGWSVYSDLTAEQMREVEGVWSVNLAFVHDCFTVYIDPRFSEDKVLGKLMELAQLKHDSCCGSHIECCNSTHSIVLICDPDVDEGRIRTVMHHGKLYCFTITEKQEECSSRDWVTVRRKDLEDLAEKVEDAEHNTQTLYYSKRVAKALNLLREAHNFISDIINGNR